jgi:hypothetical protein
MPEKLEFEPGQKVGLLAKWQRLWDAASRLTEPLTVTTIDIDGEVIWRCSVIRGEQGTFKAEDPFPDRV